MIRFLRQQGFFLLRVRGSHHYFERDDVRTTVPAHGNRPLKIGILRDIGMSPSEFEQLWRK